MTVEKVCELIFEIEKEQNLFDQKIQGVNFWKLVRFVLYRILLERLNLVQTAHTKEFNSAWDKFKVLYPMIKNTYLHSVFSRNSNVDILVIEHGRKVLIKDEYIDIYTKYKVDELEKSNASYEIVDRPYLGKHYHKPSENRSYFQDITIGYLIKNFLIKEKFTNNEEEQLEDLELKLKNIFGVQVGLKALVQKRINLFKIKKTQYKKMLKKRKVKKVYLVVSYGHESLIAACQELNIECIELQHGTMNRYHLGYSFPYNIGVPYFPNKLELFGKYWQDITPIPLSSVDIKITGYPYLYDTFKLFENIERNKKQVVFLSQGTCGVELANMAYEFARQNSEYKVIHKLHPGEFYRWKEKYLILLEAIKLDNFEIVENEKHLYNILKQSNYVVGVNSTAIYESLLLECKVILLDLPGMKEYMQSLLDLGIAKKALNIEDIINQIEKDDFIKSDNDYFFRNNVI